MSTVVKAEANPKTEQGRDENDFLGERDRGSSRGAHHEGISHRRVTENTRSKSHGGRAEVKPGIEGEGERTRDVWGLGTTGHLHKAVEVT